MNPMNSKRSTLLGFALLCTASLSAGGAIAAPAERDTLQDPYSVAAIRVTYHSSDLTEPRSAERLYGRIQNAARKVCEEPGIRELARYAEYQRCYRNALDTAVAKVDATALTALHQNRMQRRATG